MFDFAQKLILCVAINAASNSHAHSTVKASYIRRDSVLEQASLIKLWP